MNIKEIAGQVNNTSILPTFDSVLPSLIHPDNITDYDDFQGGVETVAGSPLSNSPTGKTWQGFGSTGVHWKRQPDGSIVNTNSSLGLTPTIFFEHKSSGSVYAAFNLNATQDYVGIVLGFTALDNCTQITLYRLSNVLTIQKYSNGSRVVNVSIPVDLDEFDVQHLKVDYTASSIDVYYNFNKVFSDYERQLVSGSNVGITCRGVQHKVWEFVAG